MGRRGVGLAVAVGIVSTVVAGATAASAATPTAALTLEQRVAAAEAVERVRYRHRVGAKLPFERAVPHAEVQERVGDELRMSVALRNRWHAPVTAAMLRAEVERMVRETRMPDRLKEYFDALGNDPVLIEECLARPILVDRLAREAFESDPVIHAKARSDAAALRAALAAGTKPLPAVGARRSQGTRKSFTPRPDLPSPGPRLSVVTETPDAFVIEKVTAVRGVSEDVERFEVLKQPWRSWWAENRASFDPAAAKTVASTAGGPLPKPAVSSPPCGADDTWINGQLDANLAPRAAGSAVWTGDVVIFWGGFSEVGDFDSGSMYDPATDTWRAMSRFHAPSPRDDQVAVWTGTKMLVWGGEYCQGAFCNPVGSGARYDPRTDTWTPMSDIGAPSARYNVQGLWTGGELIVWGGSTANASPPFALGTGARYDPASDTWSPMTLNGAPSPRRLNVAVWDGREMIVWGGYSDDTALADGATYDPAADRWSPIAAHGAPSARLKAMAVWTGNVVVVWGGADRHGASLDDGARYDPASDRWTSVASADAPSARWTAHTAWTGHEMLVWGGFESKDWYLGDGARYDPVSNRWMPIPQVGAPSARVYALSVWTGEEWVLWGGASLTQPLVDGKRFRPWDSRWLPMSGNDKPPGRLGHVALWTGDRVLIWGGRVLVPFPAPNQGITAPAPYGLRYDPATESWSTMSTIDGPYSGLEQSSAVWTGREMIVWGGYWNGTVTRHGWRYDPDLDTWTPTSLDGAPTSRYGHTAVWTGTEMIVWGGDAYDVARSPDGARYDPASDTWRSMPSLDPSLGRYDHMAVWTGREMLVWGGWTPDVRNSNVGAAFDPAAETWRMMSSAGGPEARERFASAWTGTELILWGGNPLGSSVVLDTGYAYNAATDSWRTMSHDGAPSPRDRLPGAWDGKHFIAWGGSDGQRDGFLESGGLYDPVSDTWQPTSGEYEPEPTADHSATWTGSSVFFWGGDRGWLLTDFPNLGGNLVTGLDRDDDGDGYSECQGDCDDDDPAIHPGAAEVCDGLDNNCDGVADLGLADHDGDGVPACVDNCQTVPNPDQLDFDGDGIGDACETGVVLIDADNSGRVDGLDLALVARAFGASPPDPRYDPRADFDRNGVVDGDDLAFLARNWGYLVAP